MSRKVFFLIIGLALLASGCVRFDSVSTYFNGTVVVEYKQVAGTSDDYLTFRFYEPGIYEIYFSTPPEKIATHQLPNDFRQVIETVPREFVVSQHVLPNYLRVTIKKDNQTEFHDFQ